MEKEHGALWSGRQVPAFWYLSDDEHVPFPVWASSLIRLGTRIGERPVGPRRLVIAVALPTRAFAAALISAGVAIAKARVPVHGQQSAHFRALCESPRGTKVLFLERGKRHKAVLDGTQVYSGETYVRVQVTTGDKLTHLLRDSQSSAVELSDWDGDLPERQQGKRIVRAPDFLAAVIGPLAPDFVMHSRLDAAIVGPAGRLRTEITETPLSTLLPNGRHCAGTLQDVMRVRRFGPQQAYRVDVVTDANAIGKLENTVVVYDGCQAFIKAHHAAGKNSVVVVLDRTNVCFQDAAANLNEMYMKHKGERSDALINGSDIGWGVEILAYEEVLL